MSKRMQLGLVGSLCFLAGWLVAQGMPLVHGNFQETKAPRWLHAMELKARKAGEASFTKETKKYGVEVFRDENTGNLIYISETGSIAVVPAK